MAIDATVLDAGSGALERLRAMLREEGGLIASLLDDAAPAVGASVAAAPGAPAQLAASGPRTQSRRDEYELLVEAIYEGYLLHYGPPRVVRAPDADLRVLAGDRLYAIGLARLVELGDTTAVAELADTITLSALAQGSGNAPLAEAVWAAGARAVGWGSSEQHQRAKRLVASGAREAIEAMRTSAAGVSGAP
ncbi:MAG TPA: hypothetical protein VH081_04615 [Solirubrobacteraceae bacterium]|nr:hypothetical protein [Solirubrobacteraceae bacterium]